MAIEYVEIRGLDRELIGIIDTAKSVIWHSVYFGVGDFEIYALASQNNLNLLKTGYYVTRLNSDEVGVIESVQISNNLQDGTMITATGRFAKSILDRRLIYKLSGNTNAPTILRGNVEIAVRQVVKDNAIDCAFDKGRNIPILALGKLQGFTAKVVDENGKAAEKQVSHKNLMEYTDNVLEEYGLSAYVTLNTNDTKNLLYCVRSGTNRSIDNADIVDPVIFSKDFDNLVSSDYNYDTTAQKNAVLIGGEGEGVKRFYSLIKPAETGLKLRETWLDASSINKTNSKEDLKDAFPSGTFSGNNFVVDGATIATKVDATDENSEYAYTNSTYTGMLNTQGKQTLSQLKIKETFEGAINVTGGNYKLFEDFNLGDIVTVEEKQIAKYINVRISEVTEVQDENGYKVDIKYI